LVTESVQCWQQCTILGLGPSHQGKKEELSSTMLYMCIHAKFFPKDVGYAWEDLVAALGALLALLAKHLYL
jgi:hypothetical protein